MMHLFDLEAFLLTSLRRILQTPEAPALYKTCEASKHVSIGDQWHLQLCLDNGDCVGIVHEVLGCHRCAQLIAGDSRLLTTQIYPTGSHKQTANQGLCLT